MVLFISLWRLRQGFPSRRAVVASIIVLSGLALMAAQLIPLPFWLWSKLPGRGFVAQGFDQIGVLNQVLPLSLSASSTIEDIVFILPGLAAFFSALTVSRGQFKIVGAVFVVTALVCAFVGLAQRFQGQGGFFNFFHEPGVVLATGFFANRNFFAAQLYTAIPWMAVFIVVKKNSRTGQSALNAFLAFVFTCVIVAGLGAASSRAGIALGMLSILLTSFLVGTQFGFSSRHRKGRIALVIFFIATIIFAQLGMAAFLRLAETDAAADFRRTIFQIDLQALVAYFPVGSGFGTFVPIYQLFETPATVGPAYINHAHNDWFELLIEGGLPMAVILTAFLFWFLKSSYSIFRLAEKDVAMRAASFSVFLLLLHSLVDYPLRTQALMTLFGICCGIIAAADPIKIARKVTTKSPQSWPKERQEFRPAGRSFTPRNDQE